MLQCVFLFCSSCCIIISGTGLWRFQLWISCYPRSGCCQVMIYCHCNSSGYVTMSRALSLVDTWTLMYFATSVNFFVSLAFGLLFLLRSTPLPSVSLGDHSGKLGTLWSWRVFFLQVVLLYIADLNAAFVHSSIWWWEKKFFFSDVGVSLVSSCPTMSPGSTCRVEGVSSCWRTTWLVGLHRASTISVELLISMCHCGYFCVLLHIIRMRYAAQHLRLQHPSFLSGLHRPYLMAQGSILEAHGGLFHRRSHPVDGDFLSFGSYLLACLTSLELDI